MNQNRIQTISQTESKVTTIPVRTWSWLHVNDTTITTIEETELRDTLKIQHSEEVTSSHEIEQKEELNSLCDQKAETAYEEQFQKKGVTAYTIRIPENHRIQDPIRITTNLNEESRASIEDIVLYAGKSSQATVYLEGLSGQEKMETEDDTLGYYHLGRVRIILEEGASLNLVKAEFYSENTSHQEIFGALLKDQATLRLIDSPLGSKGAIQNWNIILEGRESDVSMDLLYIGDGEKRLDFTSRLEFRGEKTRGELRTKGILLGKSRKILRDTLDFISGSRGSVGREVEDVLLLSSKVRNLSVPLLLCGEDDVVGEHAATSGKSDDRVLFYLMSRGLSEEESKLLLAESKFAGVLDQIEDEFIKNEMIQYLRKAMKKEA